MSEVPTGHWPVKQGLFLLIYFCTKSCLHELGGQVSQDIKVLELYLLVQTWRCRAPEILKLLTKDFGVLGFCNLYASCMQTCLWCDKSVVFFRPLALLRVGVLFLRWRTAALKASAVRTFHLWPYAGKMSSMRILFFCWRVSLHGVIHEDNRFSVCHISCEVVVCTSGFVVDVDKLVLCNCGYRCMKKFFILLVW